MIIHRPSNLRSVIRVLQAAALVAAFGGVCPSDAVAQSHGGPVPGGESQGPSRQELDGARHRLNTFKRKVELARGQPMRLDHDANEALRRIKDLKERFPNDPAIEELVQEARTALMASKGEMVEVGEDVLAYRQIEQQLKRQFKDMAEAEWQTLKARLLGDPDQALATPWPMPLTDETDPDETLGRWVVLEGFQYPRNQFMDLGRNYVYIGSPSKGFYFVEAQGRAWTGAYEAFRRYRRFINRDIPEETEWTVLGRIVDIGYLVPEAAKEKTLQAEWGWIVRPLAIYVPDRTLAISEPAIEAGGRFSGEERVESIKDAFYTVKAIPEDVTPERLIEIFSIAIKEKNFDLYLDCIVPERRVTRVARELCTYHWDWHQYRFATFYARIDILPASVRVIEGHDEGNETEAFFLSPEEREKIKTYSGRLVEEATVLTKAFDEKGRQYGSPKTFYLRRIDKGRWHVLNYAQPF